MRTSDRRTETEAPDRASSKAWLDVAKRRLSELRSGRVKAVPADEVFARIRQRLAEAHFGRNSHAGNAPKNVETND